MLRPVDLHIHSCNSDGTFTPSRLIELAADQGIAAVALADHDSVSGIDEAVAAGLIHGVEVIPAVELSVEYNGFHDIHLLGYFIDHRDPVFLDKLEQFRARRDRRGAEIIERINAKLLQESKGRISYDEVAAVSGEALGRPHIARILVSKGYAGCMEDAFDNYLVPCNVPKSYFPAGDAVGEIRRINGLAVLAHPTSITRDRVQLRRVIADFANMGLDGIEAYNNLCSFDETDFLAAIARRYGLAVTGGSDFHGNADEGRLGIENGKGPINYGLVEALKLRLRRNLS